MEPYPAWTPTIARFPGRPDERSHFGGRPLLVAGEPSPACPTCLRAYPLLAQLDLATLPMVIAPQQGLLQIFACTSDGCTDALIRVVAGRYVPPATMRTLPQQTIAGWTETTVDHAGDRLGGAGSATCHCAAPMRPLLQLAAGQALQCTADADHLEFVRRPA